MNSDSPFLPPQPSGTPVLLGVSMNLRNMWLLTWVGTLHVGCVWLHILVPVPLPLHWLLPQPELFAAPSPSPLPPTAAISRSCLQNTRHPLTHDVFCFVLFCMCSKLVERGLGLYSSLLCRLCLEPCWHIGDIQNIETVHRALEVQESWGLHYFYFRNVWSVLSNFFTSWLEVLIVDQHPMSQV